MSPPVEVLEIRFQNSRLPGYFVSGGEGKRPLLIAMSGFDGSGEELYHMIGRAASERGWHCLIFEGPGQRGALHLNPKLLFRPDYEVPVRVVVDYAVSRQDVDQERLALIGYSFGGNLAPRAAAFDDRIRACIADSLVVDVGEAWRSMWPAALRDAPDLVFDTVFATLAHGNPDARWGLNQARWSMGIQHAHEMFRAFEPYTLRGLEDKLTCPLLSLFGEDEIAQTSKKLIEETVDFVIALNCSREFHLFTRKEGAASHCQFGGLSLAHAAIFDWLGRVLGAQASKFEPTESLVLPEEFLNAVERYHGTEFAERIVKQKLSDQKPVKTSTIQT